MDDLWSEMEKQFSAVLQAKDVDDVYLKYEEMGIMLRVDKTYWPTRMRGATITMEELEKVRSVQNIIRQGRIKEISPNSIVFLNGSSVEAESESLYVDCSASGCGLGAHVWHPHMCGAPKGDNLCATVGLPSPPTESGRLAPWVGWDTNTC